MVTCSILFSKRKSLDRNRKHPRQTDTCRNSIPYINNLRCKFCQHPIQGNQRPERAGHRRLSPPPSIRYMNTEIHTPSTKTRGHQEEKTHHPPCRFKCLFPDLYLIGETNVRAPVELMTPTLHCLVKDTPRSIYTIVCIQLESYVYHWYRIPQFCCHCNKMFFPQQFTEEV